MNKRTLKALHGSVRKWIAIAEWKGEDKGGSNCPLCEEFYHKYDDKNCAGCPVRGRTGKPGCRDTPYAGYIAAQRDMKASLPDDFNRVSYPEHDMPFNPKTQRAAEKEALFLISLLPEAEQKRYVVKP